MNNLSFGKCPKCRTNIFARIKKVGKVWRICPVCKTEITRSPYIFLLPMLLFLFWGVYILSGDYIFGIEAGLEKTVPLNTLVFLVFITISISNMYIFGYTLANLEKK